MLAAAFGASVASAQDRPEPLRDRTGPGAGAPTSPAYAEPAPPLAPPVAEPVARTDGYSQGVILRDVAVSGGSGTALPQPGWVPESDAVANLSLAAPGNTGFDGDWVKAQFARNGLIGPRVPVDRLTGLIQLINLAFVRNGFINSGVRIGQSQLADGGTLQLELIHGRLIAADGRPALEIGWSERGPQGLTAAYVARRMDTAEQVPLNALEVERAFRALAENPAISTVRADLRPGARPGEASLALTIDPAERFDFYTGYANSRAPAIGSERFAAGGAVRNLLTAGDMFSAELGLTAGQPDVSAAYQAPFIDPRTQLVVRGGYNLASVVDRPLLPLDISARDWNIEGGFNRFLTSSPLMPKPGGGWKAARSFSIGARVAHRESTTFLLGEPFSFAPGAVNGRTHYTALRLLSDWVVRSTSQVTAASLTFTLGLDGSRVVPTNPQDAAAILQRVPKTDFRAVLLQASHARRLTKQGLELRLRFTGQWSSGLLYSGERVAAGGEFSVRGYRETLALVDRAAIGSVELYQPVNLGGRSRTSGGFNPGGFGLAIFADGALIGNARDQQPNPRELASVGAGLEWVPSEAISARITYAYGLVDAPQVGSRDLQDRGVQFRITIRPQAL
ncbi:MAG: ShlB/FhaC/HecB family hemolysin secretion/activation protein, partial [Sphingomonadales bacterium]